MNTKFYICDHCKNVITFAHNSEVPISCCGEPMKELIPNTTEAATEKHIPIVERNGIKVTVSVGETEHPMTEEHSIEWLAVETDDELILKRLKPNEAPKAEFFVGENKKITVFAYCNLHSLWKNEKGSGII